jgi:hypothetical protein
MNADIKKIKDENDKLFREFIKALNKEKNYNSLDNRYCNVGKVNNY